MIFPYPSIEAKGYAIFHLTAAEYDIEQSAPEKYLVAFADKNDAGVLELYISTVLSSSLQLGNDNATRIGADIEVGALDSNEQPLVNIAELKNGNLGINLSKIDPSGNITQIKFVEMEYDANVLQPNAKGRLHEVGASIEFPGFISLDFQVSELGSGDDLVFGDDDRDHISTGGGNDKVSSGAGDDIVVVQGQGDVEVDTGVGDDRVVVDSSFSGTLFIKNGTKVTTS